MSLKKEEKKRRKVNKIKKIEEMKGILIERGHGICPKKRPRKPEKNMEGLETILLPDKMSQEEVRQFVGKKELTCASPDTLLDAVSKGILGQNKKVFVHWQIKERWFYLSIIINHKNEAKGCLYEGSGMKWLPEWAILCQPEAVVPKASSNV
jgi:hypothetical protein